MLAARQGALGAARVLIEKGADLNLTDPDGTSALVMAIINGHYDVAALLVEQGADPNIADTSGMAALYAAVDMHTQPPMINRPTRKPSGSVDNLDLVKALLAHGANPNVGTPDAAPRALSQHRRRPAGRRRDAADARREIDRRARHAPAARGRRRSDAQDAGPARRR